MVRCRCECLSLSDTAAYVTASGLCTCCFTKCGADDLSSGAGSGTSEAGRRPRCLALQAVDAEVLPHRLSGDALQEGCELRVEPGHVGVADRRLLVDRRVRRACRQVGAGQRRMTLVGLVEL